MPGRRIPETTRLSGMFFVFGSSKFRFFHHATVEMDAVKSPRLFGSLLKESIIASHPVGMEKVGSAGFFFLPKRHLSPFQRIRALVAATRAAGNPSGRRQEDRRGSGNTPPMHGRH